MLRTPHPKISAHYLWFSIRRPNTLHTPVPSQGGHELSWHVSCDISTPTYISSKVKGQLGMAQPPAYPHNHIGCKHTSAQCANLQPTLLHHPSHKHKAIQPLQAMTHTRAHKSRDKHLALLSLLWRAHILANKQSCRAAQHDSTTHVLVPP